MDSKILFRDHPDPKEKPQSIIFSVKGGHLKLDDVRAVDWLSAVPPRWGLMIMRAGDPGRRSRTRFALGWLVRPL